ncbi:hypothetical protein ACFL27_05365 [candidate division CSSED10-310 bacterium]|uniref:Uncharacterized protein n=1 Tax=candidate division CSSED10-310 bacterium TaxID=2855610 RepID=A0ABV6YTU2_UNCC1
MLNHKILLLVVSSLAMFAYAKRKEIAYATIGTLATVESKIREVVTEFSSDYLSLPKE